jgi:hypothetical protein
MKNIDTNRMPSVMCIGLDLVVSAIHREAMTSAINTDSDQAIEFIFRSEGLKAMMESVEIPNPFRMFVFRRINIAKKVDTPALAVLITTNVVDGISPSQSPTHMREEIPGGRTVIGNPTTSIGPIPLAIFLPTAM